MQINSDCFAKSGESDESECGWMRVQHSPLVDPFLFCWFIINGSNLRRFKCISISWFVLPRKKNCFGNKYLWIISSNIIRIKVNVVLISGVFLYFKHMVMFIPSTINQMSHIKETFSIADVFFRFLMEKIAILFILIKLDEHKKQSWIVTLISKKIVEKPAYPKLCDYCQLFTWKNCFALKIEMNIWKTLHFYSNLPLSYDEPDTYIHEKKT